MIADVIRKLNFSTNKVEISNDSYESSTTMYHSMALKDVLNLALRTKSEIDVLFIKVIRAL